jgi:membrane-associated phospholipid phosphatase
MTRRISACAMALGLGLACSAQGRTVALDPLWDSVALASGLGAAIAAELVPGSGAKDRAPLDASELGALDAAACLPYDSGLDKASLAFAGAALLWPALFALSAEREELLPAALSSGEALAWTYAAKEVMKRIFPKARPYAYRPEGLSAELLEEAYEAFPSGHAALAFCAATSFATLALSLAPDAPSTPWLVAGGYSVAVGAGALRVLSGNHFIGDVVAGALLGSAIGYASTAAHLRTAGKGGGGASIRSLASAPGPSLGLMIELR